MHNFEGNLIYLKAMHLHLLTISNPCSVLYSFDLIEKETDNDNISCSHVTNVMTAKILRLLSSLGAHEGASHLI